MSWPQQKGYDWPKIRVGVRSGDTSQSERQKQLRKPPHIFITTPESLAMVLAAPKFREKFAEVEYVIIDEIHEVCDSKRGVHLSLTLERLQELCKRRFTRIGLSATLAPIEDIASYLVGYEDGADTGRQHRRGQDEEEPRPEGHLSHRGHHHAALRDRQLQDVRHAQGDDRRAPAPRSSSPTPAAARRAWSTSSRSGAWRASRRTTAPCPRRPGLDVEERLKNGQLRCVVSSTSLELGIDIGSVDLVCQIGSPKSVAKGLQRIGRSGHSHGKTPKGRMVVFDLDDLVECAVLCRAAHHVRNIDRVTIPENCLDVLAQSIVGMSLEKRWEVDEAYEAVRRSHCYQQPPRDSLPGGAPLPGLARTPSRASIPRSGTTRTEGVFGKKKGAPHDLLPQPGHHPRGGELQGLHREGGHGRRPVARSSWSGWPPGTSSSSAARSYEFVRAKGMKAFVKLRLRAQAHRALLDRGDAAPLLRPQSMEIARFRREMAARLDDPEEENIALARPRTSTSIPGRPAPSCPISWSRRRRRA